MTEERKLKKTTETTWRKSNCLKCVPRTRGTISTQSFSGASAWCRCQLNFTPWLSWYHRRDQKQGTKLTIASYRQLVPWLNHGECLVWLRRWEVARHFIYGSTPAFGDALCMESQSYQNCSIIFFRIIYMLYLTVLAACISTATVIYLGSLDR